MEEVIKYFEGLEERIATLEAELASLEAEVEELKNRPQPEPQVVEKVVEKPVEVVKEVVKEVVVEKPVVVAAPIAEKPSEVSVQPSEVSVQPSEEPQPEAVVEKPSAVSVQPSEKPAKEEPKEEVASPKAALYGKSVTDIRQAISLGDRFLYQRELFGQNAELMQRTLTELDGLSSFDEAVEYVSSHFQWDTESNTYQQFLVTLHRRFG